MPRPTNKQQLISLANENFTKLFKLVNSFDQQAKKAEFIFDNNRDKNIKDILVHLHHWHFMMLNWHCVGMTGQKPDMPATGYTWKTIKELNKEIWQKYQTTDFDTAVKLLNHSFEEVINTIKNHSNEELFEKKRYPWTGTTSMGSYFISATSSHYDWAMKLLRKYKKSTKNNLV
jgi:hypothetical protein